MADVYAIQIAGTIATRSIIAPGLRALVLRDVRETTAGGGEILSLQWRDVSLERRELTIRAEKEKTRRERFIPISSRLLATLQMRQQDPAGHPLGPDAHVFGDVLGRQIKCVWEAWKSAGAKAGLTDFQLRDLRHEAASRFDEAGIPVSYVSTMLGHSSLTTTSRYLNLNRRGLHLARQKDEESRAPRSVEERQGNSESVAQRGAARTSRCPGHTRHSIHENNCPMAS